MPPKLLNEEDIREALRCLSTELGAAGELGELIIVGGAAIALCLGGRKATHDVDGYFSRPDDAAVMRAAARRVASTLDLPDDWLNDGAKGYMHGTEKGECVFSGANLQVFAVPYEQLLAMKLCAWRDEQDFEDAERLMKRVSEQPPQPNRGEVWERIEKFIPPGQATKAGYAFDDLWEQLNP